MNKTGIPLQMLGNIRGLLGENPGHTNPKTKESTGENSLKAATPRDFRRRWVPSRLLFEVPEGNGPDQVEEDSEDSTYEVEEDEEEEEDSDGDYEEEEPEEPEEPVGDEGQQENNLSAEQSQAGNTQSSGSQHEGDQLELSDDGEKRCTLEDPLRYFVNEVMEGIDDTVDDTPTAPLGAGEKNKKKVRGPGIPLPPSALSARPRLVVVGDGEFTSNPLCSKIITTIRMLTLWNMPGPYRSYKAFPFETRLSIARKFLRRYTWEEG